MNNNIYPESTSDKNAIRLLIDYFLGKDWYVVDPISHDQINTIAVNEIIKKYPKKKKLKIIYE